MNLMRSWQRFARGVLVVAGLTAVLGGCVIYPAGGDGGHRHYYWR
jgi:hypothetical protein